MNSFTVPVATPTDLSAPPERDSPGSGAMTTNRAKRPSQLAIAKAAGLSCATLSFALRGGGGPRGCRADGLPPQCSSRGHQVGKDPHHRPVPRLVGTAENTPARSAGGSSPGTVNNWRGRLDEIRFPSAVRPPEQLLIGPKI